LFCKSIIAPPAYSSLLCLFCMPHPGDEAR
jgi:hypothetical protein